MDQYLFYNSPVKPWHIVIKSLKDKSMRDKICNRNVTLKDDGVTQEAIGRGSGSMVIY